MQSPVGRPASQPALSACQTPNQRPALPPPWRRLVGNQLEGPIPPSLALPDSLSQLSFFANKLTGSIPVTLKLPAALENLVSTAAERGALWHAEAEVVDCHGMHGTPCSMHDRCVFGRGASLPAPNSSPPPLPALACQSRRT